MKNGLNNQNVKLAGLFVASMAILFVLSLLQITASWMQTPSFFLMAFAGFFLTYMALNWVVTEEKVEFVYQYYFGPLFLGLGIIAHIIAATFYFQNNVQLTNASAGFVSALGVAFDYVSKNWWSLLSNDPYFMLLLGGTLAWVSFLVLSKQQ